PAARPRTDGMEWLLQRCRREAVSPAAWRAALLASCGLLVLCVGVYPGLWSIGVRLHSAVTGSYVPGHHSVLLLNSPNEQVAKDIGRAIMERRLAASVNHSLQDLHYGEVQDASEILMLVKTKTSRIQQVTDYVKSVHPYANPEVLSFPVEGGSLSYMKWMDEAIPDD
uniref:Zgc:63972 n=1 Tax=Scophthalmus maximus TaxID=52904 RepID=A0A8D3AFC3_SCOMX